MALGNLSVKVNADISGWKTSMDIARDSAVSSMGASTDSMEDFRSILLQTSKDMQAAALAMGGNMQAANRAIMDSSEQSAQAIEKIGTAANDVDFRSMGEKITYALGTGVGAGIVATNTALDAFESYIKAKLIITGLAIATGVAAAVYSTVYAAYKAVDIVADMMSGEFFKSKNIDALIEANTQLEYLQKNLGVSSIEAGALGLALKKLDVSPSDYASVYAHITEALHSNGDELERLGVKYKDADGHVLENRQVLENAKKVLDGYTEGWDRNKAAAALGIGS